MHAPGFLTSTRLNEVMKRTQQASVVLLWDIDGTLITHAPAPIDRHMRAASQALGRQTQKVGSGLGKTDRQIIIEIIEGSDVEPTAALIQSALDALDAITAEDLKHTPSQPVPGVHDVLCAFQERGVDQVLLTGNTPARAREKVDSAGLGDFFAFSDGFYGAQARDRFDVTSQARDALGHQDESGRPRTLIVLGDTPLDVRAGRHGEMLTVAIATGAHEYHELAQESPDLALRDFTSDQHLLIRYVVNLLG